MKKIFFLLIASCGFMIAQAQPLAAPSTVTVAATLNLANALELQVNGDFDIQTAAMSASFVDEEDYENPKILAQGANFGSIDYLPFSYSSNRHVNITINTPALFTGGSGTMPRSVLDYLVNSNLTGGTAPAGWGNVSAATLPVITNGLNGGDDVRSFNVQLRANPGFAYPGGTYTMNILFTATQL